MFIDKRNPIGIYEKALPCNLGWFELLSKAKEIGFDYVEMSIDETDHRLNRLNWTKEEIRELKDIILELDMPILSICLSGHRRFPLGSLDPSIREKGMNIMKSAIELAFSLGIRVVQLAGYDVFYDQSNEKTRSLFYENIEKSISYASRCGVVLAMETMDYKLTNSVTKIMNIVKRINSPWFQIYPDIGNLSAWQKDVEDELELGIEHCVAVHIKETNIDIFKGVPFHEGNVAFKSIVNKLLNLGYEGPLMIEMWMENNPDAEKISKEVLGFIKNIISEHKNHQLV